MYTTSISGLNSTALAGLGIGFAFFIFIVIIAMFVMAILAYIFQSLAFYRFMKNRNIENAFLAWIPIVRAYTVGKVYDDINAKQDKKTNFSVILLIVNCMYWGFCLFFPRIEFLALFSGVTLWGLYLAALVLDLICFNLIFKKYVPSNSSYFVLTIIFSIIPIVPFIPGLCLLKASNNEPVSETDN